MESRRNGNTRWEWIARAGLGLIGLGGLVGLAAWVGPPMALAFGMVALPFAGGYIGGMLTGRAAVVGGATLAFGATLIRPGTTGIPWAEVGLLSGVCLIAVLAGHVAVRAAAIDSSRLVNDERWVTIVVAAEPATSRRVQSMPHLPAPVLRGPVGMS